MSVRIVIIGGGFGGVYTLLSLRRHLRHIAHTITLISPTDYFSFTPFLTEVATDMLPSDDASTHITNLIKKGSETYIKGRAKQVNLLDKKVYLSEGQELSYDYLIVAIGSTTNFMNVPGASQYCLCLKDISDAEHIKTKVEEIFEQAATIQDPNERKRLLTFAIIGGGPTGIELAGDLEDHINILLTEKFHNIQKSETCVEIVTGSHLAKELDDTQQKRTEELVQKDNICLRLNARVQEIKKDRIILTDKTEVMANLIIWAAGVKPNDLTITPADVLDPQSKKFMVNSSLQLPGYPEVFAIGDIAVFTDTTKKLPMLAQAALSEGTFVGKNIQRDLEHKSLLSYEYHSKGELIAIGKGRGVANIYGIDLSGKIVWFLWKMIYLYKYIEWKKKPTILYYWITDLFK